MAEHSPGGQPVGDLSRRSVMRAVGLTTVAGAGLAAACSRSDSSVGSADSTPAPAAASAGDAQITEPATGITMTPGYAATLGRTAYVWGWPLVNMFSRRASVTEAPHPGLLNGTLPIAPQGRLAMLSDYIAPAETFVTCPNQDVIYGLGYFSLDDQPVIAQVPDFGDRFWVYAMYDGRTDQFGELGKQYRTKPGFYLLVGPNWQGDKPKGVADVIRCPTSLANVVPRVFKEDTPEDAAAVQPVINQINCYPLREFTGKAKTTSWAQLPTIPGPQTNPATGETKWVVPEHYFDQLGVALHRITPLPGEEALYAQFRVLLDSAENHPDIKKVLVDTAVATERDVITPFFEWAHNGVAAGNGWNRSANNAQFGYDYFNRTATAKSNMFENRPAETQYFYTDNDSSGAGLRGNRQYTVTFPAGQEPPVKGFWSITLYNDRHMFHPNSLNRYSVGTKSKNLKRGSDGSLTVYVGAKSPGSKKESNWLPAPDGKFSLFIRAYWGEQAILDGTWKPPGVQPV